MGETVALAAFEFLGAAEAVAATTFIAGTSLTAVTIAGALINTVGTSLISAALSPTPSSAFSSAPAMRARKQAIRSSVAPRTLIYGTARVSGPMVYAASSNDGARLNLVIPLAAHEVAGIDDVYLNDNIVDTAPPASVSQEIAEEIFVAAIDAVTANNRLTALTHGDTFAAVVTLLDGAAAPMTDVSPAAPTAADEYSLVVLDPRNAPSATYVCFSDAYSYDSADITYTYAEATETSRYYPFVDIRKHLGADDQEADEGLMGEMPDEWTSAHRLRGIAHIVMFLDWDINAFPTGLPSPSAIVRGKLVFDPRAGVSAWSENPSLCILDWLRSEFGVEASDDEIDFDSFVAAANVCDELVETLAGTEKRYTLNGVISLDSDPASIVEAMLSSCGGVLAYSGGQYRLHVGAYNFPSWVLDEDDLRGPIRIVPRQSRSQLFNGVRGVYIDPDQRWEPADYPPQTSSAYIIEDGGERIVKDLPLSFTTSPSMAQRLARQTLERSRRALTVEMPCKLTALPVRLWDVVSVSNDALRWVDREFRVVNWRLAEDGGVDLVLQEEVAAAYDWDAETQEISIEPGAEPTLPDVTAVLPPTDVVVTSNPLVTAEGVQIPRLAVTWTASADAFLLGYELEYKRRDATGYSSGFPLGDVTVTAIAYLDNGVAYDIRLRALNSRGAVSAWVEVKNTTAAGDTTPPAVPSSFSATGGSGQIDLAWTNPSDTDFSRCTVWRHTSNASGSATQIGTVYGLPGQASSYSDTGLGSGTTRYYWIKSVDTSSNASAFSTGANATTT